MIDLHCHLLPGIDDGARDEETALAMAGIAVDDGIGCIACTPHIYPGVYENTGEIIRTRLAGLRRLLADAGIGLELSHGADAHLVPEMLDGLRSGRIPTLGGTRYFLLEPPHHVAPPRFRESVFNTLAAGFVPLITHPERLTWIAEHYEEFLQLAGEGAWIQITAGSLAGRFGREARYWGEQFLDDGVVHVIATDAHDPRHRPPLLAEGREAAAGWVGEEEAARMVNERPRAVLENREPAAVTPALAYSGGPVGKGRRGLFRRLWPF